MYKQLQFVDICLIRLDKLHIKHFSGAVEIFFRQTWLSPLLEKLAPTPMPIKNSVGELKVQNHSENKHPCDSV